MNTMAQLTEDQQRRRNRVEALIGVMAPFLDMVLAAGDRISRIAEPEDHEYYPVRPGGGDPRSPIGSAGGSGAPEGDPRSA